MEWLTRAYNVQGDTLFEAIQNRPAITDQRTQYPAHRYISEDVPMSLVPIARVGGTLRRLGERDQRHDPLGCILHSTDYWRKGRTLDKLGIKDLM